MSHVTFVFGCSSFTKQYIAGSSLRINEINVYCGSYLPSWRGKGLIIQ